MRGILAHSLLRRAFLFSCVKMQHIKLNYLRAKWPMEPALISGFCCFKRMGGFDSPWMGYQSIAATHLPTPEGWKAELA